MTFVRSKALCLGAILALSTGACDNDDDDILASGGSGGASGAAGRASAGAGGKTSASDSPGKAGSGGVAGGSSSNTYENDATTQVKDYVNAELAKLKTAAEALHDAAPEADDDGWNPTDDAEAVDKMKSAWRDARSSYEHVEGSIAVLFEQQDIDTDERYDGFIETKADDNLFDDEGVIGVHAIERILWSDSIPERVVAFESKLDGYKAAAFPATKQEADDFKNKLTARLITDIGLMNLGQRALDSTSAFYGMIGSMNEQSEKTTLAARGEDESRYAQNTLADMRANLIGARAVYEAFKPWVEDKTESSSKIESEFDAIDAAYSAVDGDALPPVPETFDPEKPSQADLDSEYGKLWSLLNEKVDANKPDSVVSIMGDAAVSMGIPGIQEE